MGDNGLLSWREQHQQLAWCSSNMYWYRFYRALCLLLSSGAGGYDGVRVVVWIGGLIECLIGDFLQVVAVDVGRVVLEVLFAHSLAYSARPADRLAHQALHQLVLALFNCRLDVGLVLANVLE